MRAASAHAELLAALSGFRVHWPNGPSEYFWSTLLVWISPGEGDEEGSRIFYALGILREEGEEGV